VPINTDIKNSIEAVMKEEFLNKAHKKFHDKDDQ
jgi:hypothetical protein